MRKFIFFCILMFAFSSLRADHITGGEMSYTYVSSNNGQHTYNVYIKLFMTCNENRRFNDPTIVSVFNKATNVRVMDINVNLQNEETLRMNTFDPCITNPPAICFRLGHYYFTVTVPESSQGYILSMQVNYRVNGISNFVDWYNNVGATYSAELPGKAETGNTMVNNSAKFTGNDLVVVCADNSFSYDFSATDPDGDELRYSFCNAYMGGPGGGGNNSPQAPSAPPYSEVPYENISYTGGSPLGSRVKIDNKTGLITGIAPPEGIYVVTVCVDEIRDGKIISTQRKDLQLNITSCSIAAAALDPEYQLCDESFNFMVANNSNSNLIKTYNWTFYNNNGTEIYTSDNNRAGYTFSDTGLYKIKLAINRGEACSDSAESFVRVYPGFNPDFTTAGICVTSPVQFLDRTASRYGTVNYRSWDFNIRQSGDDQSDQQNPQYLYDAIGPKEIRLIVGDNLGCLDTLTQIIDILDKPPLALAFKDTLICSPDQIELFAEGQGNFTWTGGTVISGGNTATPIVKPGVTTTYYVNLNYLTCNNTDSIKINVVDFVQLNAGPDTTVCTGDPAILNISSNGLKYEWVPAVLFSDEEVNKKHPQVLIDQTRQFQVIASIGSCSANTTVRVNAVAYPLADAGNDTVICYNSPAFLSPITNGSIYQWASSGGVIGNNLQQTIFPEKSGQYYFTAYDNKGCPKPVTDSMFVTVLPPINAFAGNDTAVVIGQPLQLSGKGGISFEWSPPFGLSDPGIQNPVATFFEPSNNVRYRMISANEYGCKDTSFIMVKIFHSGADVFVPNAFTPNNDGINDKFKFVAAGIQNLHFFRIYNRNGSLIYNSNSITDGWDGNVNGYPQQSGTYVWMLQATDYTGKLIQKKGVFILVR